MIHNCYCIHLHDHCAVSLWCLVLRIFHLGQGGGGTSKQMTWRLGRSYHLFHTDKNRTVNVPVWLHTCFTGTQTPVLLLPQMCLSKSCTFVKEIQLGPCCKNTSFLQSTPLPGWNFVFRFGPRLNIMVDPRLTNVWSKTNQAVPSDSCNHL